MLLDFNCTSCGVYNPTGNTNCYVCMAHRPIHCNYCGVNNNPVGNTHCYNCGHVLHDYVVHNNHSDDVLIDLNGDGIVDIIID